MCENQSKPFSIHFSGPINLIIGGNDDFDDYYDYYYNDDDDIRGAQIVNLSNKTSTCNSFPDYPIAMSSATGAIVSGQPIICGGWSGSAHSECYKYSKGTSISNVRFFKLDKIGLGGKVIYTKYYKQCK